MFSQNPYYHKLSDQQFSSLNSLCDEFDEQLQDEAGPALEDFLTRTAEPDRKLAFAELLAIEIEFRSARGERPSVADYETRFADDHETIVGVFRETLPRTSLPGSTAAPATSTTPPSGIGDFRIIGELGRGGMGVVYEAHHQRLDRRVALKLLLPEVATNVAIAERFLREGQALARLQHPNIVSVYDASESDGQPFLAMEFVDGRSLAEIVRDDGPLDVPTAVGLTIQTARGMEYAHRQGVIHRDIKPSNLLLDSEGTIRILDLGLATFAHNEPTAGSVLAVTKTGDVMGTAQFMAPEQAADIRSAQAASDVYSLGCTLFYLLTGRVLHQRDTIIQTILAHREEPPPSLRERCPDVSPELEATWLGMVASDHKLRTSSMSAVIAELSNAANANQAATKALPSLFYTATVLALLLLVLCGVWLSGIVPLPSRDSRPEPMAEAGSPDVSVPNGDTGVATIESPGIGDGDTDTTAPKRTYWTFDGETNYIHIPSIAPKRSTEITVEAWVRLPATSSARNICELDGPTNVQIGCDDIQFFGIDSRMWGETESFEAWPRAYHPGQWQHVAIVSDAHEMRMYVDGRKYYRRYRSENPEALPAKGLYIGTHPYDDSITFHFAGDIDEVQISNRALYRDEFVPNPRLRLNAQTIALYHFDEPPGTWLVDAGPQKHHAAAAPGTWSSRPEQTAPPRTFWSFDGKTNSIRLPNFAQSASDTVTTEAWVRPRPTADPQAITGAVAGPGQLGSLLFRSVENEHSSNQADPMPNLDTTAWRWRHLAKVVTPMEVRFYLDGLHRCTLPREKQSAVPERLQSSDLFIGSEPSSDDNQRQRFHFHGDIDELRVSRSERYTSEFTPEPRLSGEDDAETILLLHFDDAPGTALADSSQQNQEAIPSVGNWDEVTARNPDRTFWAFDGETTSVHVPGIVRNANDETTLEAWVRPYSRSGSPRVICQLYDSPRLQLGHTADTVFGMDGRTHVYPFSEGDHEARLNFDTVWHHVAIVTSKSETRFYLDGRRCWSFPRTTVIDERPQLGLYIGGEPVSDADSELGYFFHGDIDELRLSSTVRYTETFVPQLRFSTDDHTMLLFHFDDEAGSVLTDSSGNGRRGTPAAGNWR